MASGGGFYSSSIYEFALLFTVHLNCNHSIADDLILIHDLATITFAGAGTKNYLELSGRHVEITVPNRPSCNGRRGR